MSKKSQVDGGDDMKPQSVKAEKAFPAKGVAKKRKKRDAYIQEIRKQKDVVDVKRVGPGVYEVAIA